MDHICTNESMCTDKLIESTCPVCFKKIEPRAGYIGIYYPCCKTVIDDSDFIGSICKRRRILLNLTKSEMGKIMNRSKYTIDTWERYKCPEKYLEKTEEMILK